MDLTFKLIPEDLSNYRYAVRDRLTALPGNGIWSKHWVRAGLTISAGAGLFLILDRVVPGLTGHELSMTELGLGIVMGFAFFLAILWLNHFEQAKKLVRADGPTMSEHTVSVNTTGLNVTAPHMTAHYAWAAFQDVTAVRNLVVLWIEPAFGLVIPKRAFANDEARDAFIAAIEARRTESGLPRAGSFA